MNTKAELGQALEDFEAGLFGEIPPNALMPLCPTPATYAPKTSESEASRPRVAVEDRPRRRESPAPTTIDAAGRPYPAPAYSRAWLRSIWLSITGWAWLKG
jgi:hypothetical protein